MRLPQGAHTSRGWRIHELAPEFRVEDVWRLPWRGRAEEFPLLVGMITADNPLAGSSGAVRALTAIREKLGKWLGWDEAKDGLGSGPTLRARLPADLRQASPPAFAALPFNSLYLLEDEFAAEVANRTMHGVLHLGCVPDGSGAYEAHMAILVKPNGALGKVYMAAIKPFRHLIVYPALLRYWERAWSRQPGGEAAAQAH